MQNYIKLNRTIIIIGYVAYYIIVNNVAISKFKRVLLCLFIIMPHYRYITIIMIMLLLNVVWQFHLKSGHPHGRLTCRRTRVSKLDLL